MATKTKLPKGYFEVHYATAYKVDEFPIAINARMVCYVTSEKVEKDAYRQDFKVLTRLMVKGHNNAGFHVAESYEDVLKAIDKALAEID